jgi:hypothetical protein
VFAGGGNGGGGVDSVAAGLWDDGGGAFVGDAVTSAAGPFDQLAPRPSLANIKTR